MIILGVDAASQTGWAVFDTDKHPSAIISGSYGLPAKDEDGNKTTMHDRIRHIRRSLAVIIKTYQPAFCAIEAPWQGNMGVVRGRNAEAGFFGDDAPASKSDSNPHALAITNRICGATEMLVCGLNVPMVSLPRNTWAASIPKNLRVFKNPKKSVQNYCDFLRIVSPNEDSRDACIIALVGAGYARNYKVVR